MQSAEWQRSRSDGEKGADVQECGGAEVQRCRGAEVASYLYSQESAPPQASSLFSSSTYSPMFDLVRNLIFFTAAGGSHACRAGFRFAGFGSIFL